MNEREAKASPCCWCLVLCIVSLVDTLVEQLRADALYCQKRVTDGTHIYVNIILVSHMSTQGQLRDDNRHWGIVWGATQVQCIFFWIGLGRNPSIRREEIVCNDDSGSALGIFPLRPSWCRPCIFGLKRSGFLYLSKVVFGLLYLSKLNFYRLILDNRGVW